MKEKSLRKTYKMPRLNLPKEQVYVGSASIFKRAIAFIIDLLIIDLVLAGPFKKLLSGIMPKITSFSELQALMNSSELLITQVSTIMIILSVLVLLYFSVMQAILSQTPGMMILSIYVIKTNKEKRRIKLIKPTFWQPTFWQALVRNIFVFPFFPFFLLWIIEPMLLIFKRRRLLEMVSGTLTVEEYSLR